MNWWLVCRCPFSMGHDLLPYIGGKWPNLTPPTVSGSPGGNFGFNQYPKWVLNIIILPTDLVVDAKGQSQWTTIKNHGRQLFISNTDPSSPFHWRINQPKKPSFTDFELSEFELIEREGAIPQAAAGAEEHSDCDGAIPWSAMKSAAKAKMMEETTDNSGNEADVVGHGNSNTSPYVAVKPTPSPGTLT